MCGIAGIVGPGRDRGEILRAMVAAIAHRGPDGEGFFDDGTAALGHRRLAVIDLSDNAAQPMGNEDGSIQIVYNGEVYNFEELRAPLLEKGHKFRSRGDTEVLVHLYEEEGDGFVAKLNGMFAFALWDGRKGRLLLGRDRFGQKPLFFAMAGEALVFGSEIKAVLRHPGVPRRISPRAVDSLLTAHFVPAPLSFYEDVHRLLPGHLLVFEPGRATSGQRSAAPVTRSYVPPPPPRDLRISFEEAVSEVDRLFTQAVKRQLVADVPVGVFASGGIDSTLILAKLCDLGQKDLSAYSLGFPQASHSELPHAEKAAKLLGIPMVPLMFEPQAFGAPERLVEMFDEPFADVAAMPTYALAKAARPKITVALTGDGGDEIFGGYEHHVVGYWLDRLRPAEAPRAWLARALVNLVPVDTRFRGPLRTLRRGLETLGCEGYREGVLQMRANLQPRERSALYTRDFQNEVALHDPYAALLPPGGRAAPVERLFGLSEDRMFADLFLHKSDVASMAAGLETRSPFLDVPLVDFAARLPLDLLVSGARGKRILRTLVERRVDKGLATRRKMGFSPPVDDWLRNELVPLVEDTLLAPGALVGAYVERAQIDRMFAEHRARRANHRRVLWALLLLELWLRRERTTSEHRSPAPTARPHAPGANGHAATRAALGLSAGEPIALDPKGLPHAVG
jgi:asparagine synthase (glutamine-hydrolysing)